MCNSYDLFIGIAFICLTKIVYLATIALNHRSGGRLIQRVLCTYAQRADCSFVVFGYPEVGHTFYMDETRSEQSAVLGKKEYICLLFTVVYFTVPACW